MTDPITLREASQLTQLAPSTFRKWISNGTLKSLKKKGNKHLVDRNEVLALAGQQVRMPQTSQRSENVLITVHESQIQLYESKIQLLERSLEREQNEKDELRGTVNRLIDEQTKLAAEIKALLDDDKEGWQLPFRWRKKS